MPEQIISASGTQFGMIVNSDGSINVGNIVGSIVIGSVSANVDNIYMSSGNAFVPSGNMFVVSGNAWSGVGSITGNVSQGTTPWIVAGSTQITNSIVPVSGTSKVTGSVYKMEGIPTSSIYNNPRFSYVYSGTGIGSVYQFIGTGSYVQSFGYSGDNLISVSAWTVV